ncbi:MAG: MFS transporter [Desulfuromonas sp.]|nr:MAG: MFS transporter [Desulfuromonas sp.]
MPEKVSRRATLLVVCLAHFLMPFMMSAVGVALPAIGRDFNASAVQLGLVETTYVLSASIFLLAMGRLGDIHGRRRIFIYGVALFTFAGGLLSQSWSIESMIGFRFLQGMGGSMVMATTMAIVVSVFPPERRGRALGVAIASVYAGISCGPFIGGLLVSSFGWRSIFYLSVPLGVSTWLVTMLRMRSEWAEAKGEPFDWVGSVVYAFAVLALIIGASNLDSGLWAWGVLALSAVGMALFVRHELRTPYPLLNMALLTGNRVFAFSNLAALFNYAATFGVTFFMSLYLQYVQGMSPRQAGLVLIVQPVTQTLLSPLAGRLADRFSAAWVATFGMALCAAGLAVAANLQAVSSWSLIYTILVLLGTGFAFFSSPNVSTIMGSVKPRYLGIASGLSSSMRTLGMMNSMIIITIIFSVLMQGEPVTTTTLPQFLLSMHYALLTFSGLCLLGIGCSLVRLRQSA